MWALKLVKGKALDDVIANLGSVAEGVSTAKAAKKLTENLGVDAPITDVVYKVIYEKLDIRKAVSALLGREMKPEVT